MPPSGSQAPFLPPRALCGPYVSPSTSFLISLVLSHGDLEGGEPECPLLGLTEYPRSLVGKKGEVEAALPPEKQGWGMPSGAWDQLTAPESRSGS